jgi:hypothetical protein
MSGSIVHATPVPSWRRRAAYRRPVTRRARLPTLAAWSTTKSMATWRC